MPFIDLFLLTKGVKYIIIFCFVVLLYNSVSASFILDRQIDWEELAYICMVNIVALWLVIKIQQYLQRRNSLYN